MELTIKLNHDAETFADVFPGETGTNEESQLKGLMVYAVENPSTGFILSKLTGIELDTPSRVAEYLYKQMESDDILVLLLNHIAQTEGMDIDALKEKYSN